MKKYLILVLIFFSAESIAQTSKPDKPITMETISPNIYVKDIKATIEFYKILGFNVVTTVPEVGNDPIFAMMTCGSATFMFQTFASIENTLPTVSRVDGGSLLPSVTITTSC
jgi:hypothetical protein